MSISRSIFLAALCIALGLDALAKPLKITRSGSKDGIHYDYVSQDPGFFVNKMNCRRPGAITCAWVRTSAQDAHLTDVVDRVHLQIEAAILGGATSGTVSGPGYEGSWTGERNGAGSVDYEANLEVEEAP